MSLDLKALERAAARYSQHRAATEQADPKVVRASKERAAKRHLELFVPPADRLAVARGVIFPSSSAPGADLFTEAEMVPEIISRDNDLRPVRFLQLAALAARCVGRIRVRDTTSGGEGDATGFMVAPGLLMTNWHVLRTAEIAAAASIIFDDEETITGEMKETTSFQLRPDHLFVADSDLDFAIVQVSPRNAAGKPLSSFGFFRLFKQTGKLAPDRREPANIIQHPGGGSKKIALRDNYIDTILPDDIDPARQLNSIFYGTDTLKGSSGSPVCSDQWYVVALHRGGVPETREIDGKRVVVRRDGSPALKGDSSSQIRYLTNEGTRISRIYLSLETKAAKDPNAEDALERMLAVSKDPRQGPFDLRTAPLLLPGLPSEEQGGIEEIIRRPASGFTHDGGYKPGFLGRGNRIGLPKESAEIKRELATLRDSTATELKYLHYSLKINRNRRTPFYVAANIDGSKLWDKETFGPKPKRPKWSYDPRLAEEEQPDDGIFSTAMQRGHLFKREDAMWGDDRATCVTADLHSFTITNATPMIAAFNNSEWGDLEDIVSRECAAGNKVSYFSGPVFRSDDPFLNELRAGVPASHRRRGMRVPQSFWKIIAWIEDGQLRAAGFILTQTNEIQAAGPISEEIDFRTYQKTSISEIREATGLRFPELEAADTFGQD